jgi:hypothetical protein
MHGQITKNILLSSKAVKGIIRIYNIQSDKTLLIESNDLAGDIQKFRFQLDMETFPNKELQIEYEQIGLESFNLEPWVIASEEENLSLLLVKALGELQDEGIAIY